MASDGKSRTVSFSGGDSESEIGHDTAADIINLIMNSSQISNASNDSTASSTFASAINASCGGGGSSSVVGPNKTNFNITHNITSVSIYHRHAVNRVFLVLLFFFLNFLNSFAKEWNIFCKQGLKFFQRKKKFLKKVCVYCLLFRDGLLLC